MHSTRSIHSIQSIHGIHSMHSIHSTHSMPIRRCRARCAGHAAAADASGCARGTLLAGRARRAGKAEGQRAEGGWASRMGAGREGHSQGGGGRVQAAKATASRQPTKAPRRSRQRLSQCVRARTYIRYLCHRSGGLRPARPKHLIVEAHAPTRACNKWAHASTREGIGWYVVQAFASLQNFTFFLQGFRAARCPDILLFTLLYMSITYGTLTHLPCSFWKRRDQFLWKVRKPCIAGNDLIFLFLAGNKPFRWLRAPLKVLQPCNAGNK